MKITTDMIGSETASVRQTRLKSVYDWYKGDGAYVAAGNLGVVRAAFNDYLTSDIANLETFASWVVKFNLLNSPDTLIRTQLFGSGAKGVWFDPNDLPTLTQVSDGTVPVTAAGQPVGRALDKSGNAAHATQAVASKRPIYGVIPKGGRRNLLTYSDEFDNVNWTKLDASVNPNSSLAPDGSMTADKLFESVSGNTEHSCSQSVPVISGSPYTFSCYLRAAGRTAVSLAMRVSGLWPSGINQIVEFTLAGAGSAVVQFGAPTFAISDVGGGWYLCSITATAAGTGTAQVRVQWDTAGGGVSGADLWRAQVAVGTSAGAHQRVGSIYDITEPGVPSLQYLASDLIDDELPATVPSLGSNATVWFAVDGASTILTGQTVAAGPIATLRGERTYTMGAIDRPLSAGETAALTTYLDKARGAL